MDILHSGPQENLKTRPISSFDHQFLGFWKVMNIIARGCSPCLLVLPGLDAEEQTLWERSTHKGGMC